MPSHFSWEQRNDPAAWHTDTTVMLGLQKRFKTSFRNTAYISRTDGANTISPVMMENDSQLVKNKIIIPNSCIILPSNESDPNPFRNLEHFVQTSSPKAVLLPINTNNSHFTAFVCIKTNKGNRYLYFDPFGVSHIPPQVKQEIRYDKSTGDFKNIERMLECSTINLQGVNGSYCGDYIQIYLEIVAENIDNKNIDKLPVAKLADDLVTKTHERIKDYGGIEQVRKMHIAMAYRGTRKQTKATAEESLSNPPEEQEVIDFLNNPPLLNSRALAKVKQAWKFISSANISTSNTQPAVPTKPPQTSSIKVEQEFVLELVKGDGNCGYSAFGIKRENAYDALCLAVDRKSEEVIALLKSPVKAALLDGNFIEFLETEYHFDKNTPVYMAFREHQAVSHGAPSDQSEAVTEKLYAFADNPNIIKAYLEYDINDKKIEFGDAHPAVLQALACIENTRLYIWELAAENSKQLKPHFEQQFQCYLPNTQQQPLPRKDILYHAKSKHFDRLIFLDKPAASAVNIYTYHDASSLQAESAVTTTEQRPPNAASETSLSSAKNGTPKTVVFSAANPSISTNTLCVRAAAQKLFQENKLKTYNFVAAKDQQQPDTLTITREETEETLSKPESKPITIKEQISFYNNKIVHDNGPISESGAKVMASTAMESLNGQSNATLRITARSANEAAMLIRACQENKISLDKIQMITINQTSYKNISSFVAGEKENLSKENDTFIVKGTSSTEVPAPPKLKT